MRVIRGRADAREMPSRRTFAITRLLSLLRMRAAQPEPAEVVLVVDRHQSAAENFTVGAWVTFTVTGFLAATLAQRWPLPAAWIAAIPLALLLFHVPLAIVSVIFFRRTNNLRLNSIVLMTLVTVAAAHFARAQSWVRFVAWQFLAVLALNAVAAVLVMLLRGAIAKSESSLGGFSSEL